VSGDGCSSDADCDPLIVGDVCVADPFEVTDGFNDTELEHDFTLWDAELSFVIARPVILHVEYRALDRDLAGQQTDALDGGAPDTTQTSLEQSIDTATALLELRPHRSVTARVGYRTIDRDLIRDGFGGDRDDDFVSDGDETVVLGLSWRATRWFKLDADYEDGDVQQAFTATSPFETERTRVRATFKPQPDMNLSLTYLDYENRNLSANFRTGPGLDYDHGAEGTNWSAAFWHKANDNVDYLLRYAENEIDTITGTAFDTDIFGVTEPGLSIFANDNTSGQVQINFRSKSPWSGFVRYWMTESEGNDIVLGDVVGVINDEVIAQDYEDGEIGVRYTFQGGLFVGAAFRSFDYDDRNDLLDYEGEILTINAGMTF
jgi:hypothetical protein